MSVCVKIWHSEETRPEGLFNRETLPDAPPNWFREDLEYAAELFALELGQDCCVSVIDDRGGPAQVRRPSQTLFDGPGEEGLMTECPGEGQCHGCLSWCDLCGDVDHVCDYPECSRHLREEEVEAQLAETERDLAALAAAHASLEAELRAGRNGPRADTVRRELSRLESSIRSSEAGSLEIGEELQSIRASKARGLTMVPRDRGPEQRPPDGAQLSLPF